MNVVQLEFTYGRLNFGLQLLVEREQDEVFLRLRFGACENSGGFSRSCTGVDDDIVACTDGGNDAFLFFTRWVHKFTIYMRELCLYGCFLKLIMFQNGKIVVAMVW